MAEKLKLVRELIPWSLVIKAIFFGAAWLALPYLLFVLAAAFLFFNPPFQAGRFSPLFLLMIWFGYALPAGPREAVFLAVLFATALGTKNLLFVDRLFVSQVLFTIASFLLWLTVFSANPRPNLSFLVTSLIASGISFLLCRFVVQLREAHQLAPTSVFLIFLSSFLSFELAWILLLLPARPVTQALLMALGAAAFLEIFTNYLARSLTEKKLGLMTSGAMAVILSLFFLLPHTLTP
ncbi:MAG: hypothetical protein AAB691_01545 [Patescibacteria group bacterium]